MLEKRPPASDNTEPSSGRDEPPGEHAGSVATRPGATTTPTSAPAGARYPQVMLALLGAGIGALIATLVSHPYANPDSHAFEAVARALLAGHGFAYQEPMLPGLTLYAYRAPAFPLFAAPLLALGGMPLVIATQGALVGVCAALVGGIAARFANRRAGWLAFLLAMAWWPSWELAGQFLSETLYTTLTVLAVVAGLAVREHGARAAAVAGALVASATLTRSIGASLALAIGVWLLTARPRALPAFALAGLIVWAPWPIRNAAHLHAFVPFTSNAAMNFYSGNSGVSPTECWRDMAAHIERGELGFERAFAERTRTDVFGRPATFARALARKLAHFLLPLDREPGRWLHLLLLPIAGLGLALVPEVRAALALPGAVWAVQAVVNVMTVTYTRYRAPSDWVIVLTAALAAVALASPGGRERIATVMRRWGLSAR